MDDLISRQQAIGALRNYLVGKNVPCDGTLTCRLIENEVISKLPPAEPELIKCDYVKACNEVTMNKTFSALRYLAMLDDFEEYGYILVKRRG